MDVRQPAAAGRFYPLDSSSLESKVRECFEHDLGPGNVPEEGVSSGFAGGIVPHAGFDFSGPCAAHVYERLVESGVPDVVVVFGTMHYSDMDYAVDDRDYRTPLGTVENVFPELEAEMEVERSVHDREHSVEVQLPFIQYFSDRFKLLPILVSTRDMEEISRITGRVSEALEDRDTVFLASTDFTHCGPRYGQPVPENMSPRQFTEEQDKKAMDMVSEGDPVKFLDTIERNGISMCGPGGVAAVMDMVGEMSGFDMLCHYSSFDLVDGRDSVGYAGVSFSN